ncbi:MAG: hypothetical protein QCI38_06880 [Candidatus Thermoplasmatota archaeon]|nr:hypothetical protein [Candidatus Thermoplasmatota archaeon]
MERKELRDSVRCPVCGTMNEVDPLEPRAVCTFCGGEIVLGEKSGL